MHHAAIVADAAVLGKHIVYRHFLHRRHRCLGLIGAGGLYALQIVQHGGIGAHLHDGWHLLALLEEALRPGARRVVAVPVEAVGQIQALGRLQAQAVDLGNVDQRCGQHLLGRDAELRRLLEHVGRVARSIRQPDHIGLGGLCLHDLR
ncbi:hypothetical protein SDC9_195358 [bioreactor metagenome]|uniref:Uncharacterized protein n=1 Tax=bioreactor metagenome TaxID=1076179 RepID=A0A645IHH4_9ZZZZ